MVQVPSEGLCLNTKVIYTNSQEEFAPINQILGSLRF